MLSSLRLFVRGPVWTVAGVLGAVATAIGVIEDAFWMWLSLGLFLLVVASFLTFHQNRVDARAKAESLPQRIDDLHREGIDLLAELSEAIAPEERGDGTWAISFDAPPERWEKAEAFDQRVRQLFIEAYPVAS
jgi:hypothetical protein